MVLSNNTQFCNFGFLFQAIPGISEKEMAGKWKYGLFFFLSVLE